MPADDVARRQDGVAIHGDIESFVSPIDGAVISDRRQYAEHCKKHNVVPASEFTPEFLAKKRKEREDFYLGNRNTAQTQRDRMEINEIINHLERRGST